MTWRATSFTCQKRYDALDMKGYFGATGNVCIHGFFLNIKQ